MGHGRIQRDELVDAAAENTVERDETERDDAHFDDIEDGCGCAEVWEHLSDRRADD